MSRSGSWAVWMRPPIRSRASSTRTRRPAAASRSAAASPAMPAPTTSTSAWAMPMLLVPEGDDGIETRRAAGRIDAEEEPHQRAEAERHHDGGRRDEGVPLHHPREHDSGADAEQDADGAAQDAERERLDEELQQDVALGGAQRLPHADLPGPLGDRHQHDVHDADAAHDQAHRGDAGQQRGEYLGGLLLGLQHVLLVADGEVVLAAGADVVLPPEHPLEV